MADFNFIIDFFDTFHNTHPIENYAYDYLSFHGSTLTQKQKKIVWITVNNNGVTSCQTVCLSCIQDKNDFDSNPFQ